MSEIVYNLGDSAVFCALHDQLASLGRHAQLTRCFSAIAELLVFVAKWVKMTTVNVSAGLFVACSAHVHIPTDSY